MRVVALLVLALIIIICAVLYYSISRERRRRQFRENITKELTKSQTILEEISTLLQQIKGLSNRHEVFFERYTDLSKEVQSVYEGIEHGIGRFEEVSAIIYRALSLREQIENERERSWGRD
jgi:hypothetical protein